MLTEQDLVFLSRKGIKQEDIEQQISFFKSGFTYLKLYGAASVAKGIKRVSDDDLETFLQTWDSYREKGKKIIKFVPASGAASRMFKDLFEFIDAPYDVPTKPFEKTFFDNITKFAFFEDLNTICEKNQGKDIQTLIASGDYKTVARNLLAENGLNYGNLPKGLLKFHKYAEGATTPVEEHLKEGAIYAKDAKNEVNIHFTVSPDHFQLFSDLIFDKKDIYEQKLSTKFNVSFSEQKPKTDTIAVNPENELFRDKGKLVFRPGGHGALIENLNDLDGDVVFIKNIDNVVPDRLKGNEAKYKKLLAGVLVTMQTKAFSYLNLIDSGKYSHDELIEILYFLQDELCIKNPETKLLEDAELVLYLKRKLDRPFRVCGMVKNVGEPGGGPFLAENQDTTISPQILESSQIDMSNAESKTMFEQGTHFNPVDLVCGIRDYRGRKFNLPDFVDKNTGFISLKSKGGKELKALELPGLWNGAMSDWNTVFVEVPIETFNPVKTVNDLLREQHQA
ncbi:MAG: DUF4301 family protein [Dysgonomonas sp.]